MQVEISKTKTCIFQLFYALYNWTFKAMTFKSSQIIAFFNWLIFFKTLFRHKWLRVSRKGPHFCTTGFHAQSWLFTFTFDSFYAQNSISMTWQKFPYPNKISQIWAKSGYFLLKLWRKIWLFWADFVTWFQNLLWQHWLRSPFIRKNDNLP